MMLRVVAFLQTVAATAAWISAAIFLRYWRQSRDALFALFAVAFTLLGVSWAILSMVTPLGDASPYVHGLRLLAFLLIIAAVVAKNREPIECAGDTGVMSPPARRWSAAAIPSFLSRARQYRPQPHDSPRKAFGRVQRDDRAEKTPTAHHEHRHDAARREDRDDAHRHQVGAE
jgi:hypothetical protein